MHTKLTVPSLSSKLKKWFSHFLLSQETRKNDNDKDYSINFQTMFLNIDIEGHALLVEYVKRQGSSQQIPFTGVPFVILGMNRLDCTHGVDRYTSTKEKRLEKKVKQL